MFISSQSDVVKPVGCAIQLTFDKNDGHNFDANVASRVGNAIQAEVNRLLPNFPNRFQPLVMQLPLPPYNLVEVQTGDFLFGYIGGGMRASQDMVWCGLNYLENDPQANINNFLTFFDSQLKDLIGVRNITRIGIIQSYSTPITNVDLTRILQSNTNFEISSATLDSTRVINENSYGCKLLITKTEPNVVAHFDVFLNRVLDVNTALTEARNMSQLVSAGNALNLLTVIS
jgi:hypothetical protein